MRGIDKAFGPVRANRGAALEVAPGEIHALVGENGAGKSTLMRILAGLYAPDAGTVEIATPDGDVRDVTGWSTADAIAAGVGMVHQHFMLVPTLTVAENIVLGREPVAGGDARLARAVADVEALGAQYRTARRADAARRRAVGRRGAARRDPQDALSRRDAFSFSTSRPRCSRRPRSRSCGACCAGCATTARRSSSSRTSSTR